MALLLGSRAQYLTAQVPNMRGPDYKATHLVKATKGLDLNPRQYSDVTIGGQPVRITQNNKDCAMDWFAEWAAAQIAALPPGPKIIVPVPSSKSIPLCLPTFRTALIADRIAKLSNQTQAVPVLRFGAERPSSREEGGSRDPHVLHGEMVLTHVLPAGEIILLDDVVTSGGHLKASAWTVEDQQRAVRYALTCGRTMDAQL